MQNINNSNRISDFTGGEWTRKDSEELIILYLKDYYDTLDDDYLKEAIQIAKDDGINFENVMRQVRFTLS